MDFKLLMIILFKYLQSG